MSLQARGMNSDASTLRSLECAARLHSPRILCLLAATAMRVSAAVLFFARELPRGRTARCYGQICTQTCAVNEAACIDAHVYQTRVPGTMTRSHSSAPCCYPCGLQQPTRARRAARPSVTYQHMETILGTLVSLSSPLTVRRARYGMQQHDVCDVDFTSVVANTQDGVSEYTKCPASLASHSPVLPSVRCRSFTVDTHRCSPFSSSALLSRILPHCQSQLTDRTSSITA